jgi:GINS complex subunit 2
MLLYIILTSNQQGPIPALQPPIRNNVPLWLALLLKKQRRANIIPPPWLTADSLAMILKIETEQSPNAFSPQPRLPPVRSVADGHIASPPFLKSSTVDAQQNALPFHWLEMGEILLEAASDDFEDANQIRTLLRDLREARLAKLRSGTENLDAGGGLRMNGVGGMELAESRGFISGVIDGLRHVKLSVLAKQTLIKTESSVLHESMNDRKEICPRAVDYQAQQIMMMTICFNDESMKQTLFLSTLLRTDCNIRSSFLEIHHLCSIR